ncbi:MAG: hypothetical protein QXW94_04385 [Desulfurococcaceae archaeon]
MGRRRKRRKVVVRRMVKIPMAFECPHCSSKTLVITVKKKEEDRAHAIISCGSCGLIDEEDFADIPALYQVVDIYAKFVDLYSSGKAKVKLPG